MTKDTKAPDGAQEQKADEKAKEKQKTAEKKPASKPDGFCVYIGPSIRGVIQGGMIMEGTKEKMCSFLAKAIENYPLIKSLIVTGATLPEDRIKVKTPGNLLHVNYMKLSGKKK